MQRLTRDIALVPMMMEKAM
ncbi:3-hydroxybutyryl-CoA dehydrogenase [Bacillus sp. NRRL B-14911]|nr:3-hydroxybutyryl-CoA dehydrogenase [Bacillus sp. NRRL B-14911]